MPCALSIIWIFLIHTKSISYLTYKKNHSLDLFHQQFEIHLYETSCPSRILICFVGIPIRSFFFDRAFQAMSIAFVSTQAMETLWIHGLFKGHIGAPSNATTEDVILPTKTEIFHLNLTKIRTSCHKIWLQGNSRQPCGSWKCFIHKA